MNPNATTMNQSLDNTAIRTTTTTTTDILQQASRYIERCLLRDDQAPTLIEQLSFSVQSGITASGLSDRDYPQLIGLPSNLGERTQIKTEAKVPLPPEIMEQFNHIQSLCMMGLFTEIQRAWLTIDSDIYLWTYADSGDVAYYDGLNETIISVGLVRPKQGVFQNFIQYLLVLATSIDIVVLGVTFSSDDDHIDYQIQLVSDPIFTIPTDGAFITTIAGSSNGRIFLGSKDGSLYEISYQAESSWFGQRCKKINHSTSKLSFLVPSFVYAAMVDEDGVAQIAIDDTRKILYMLSEKGTIEVYDMGENGNSLHRISRLTQNALVQQAHNTIRTLDNQNFYPIINISPLELYESSRINLLAISQSGVRFYLTTTTNSQMQQLQTRPTTLQLLHVRIPPGYAATTHHRPKNIHIAHYNDRNTILISSNNDKEILWSIGSDLFPFASVLMESWSLMDLDGPVLALAEIKSNKKDLLQPLQQLPPLIVRQHIEPPKKFVVLTAQGAHIISKLRPVDVLKQLLVETHGMDADAIKAYFTIQQDDQACATSLLLASVGDEEISNFATNAFFLFGGEPKLATNIGINSTMMNQTLPFNSPTMFSPNIVSTPLGSHSLLHQQQLQQQQQMQHQLSPQQINFSMSQSPNYSLYQQPAPAPILHDINSLFIYSSKHDGLYLYVSRILRPIWSMRCVEKMTFDEKKFYLTSTLNFDKCTLILYRINALCEFLQRNTQLSMCKGTTLQNTTTMQQQQQQQQSHQFTIHDAQLDERKSLHALKQFLMHASQVIGLWRILCEHTFHALMDSLPLVQQQHLQNTLFKELILYGHDICTTLINTLINSYLGDNASVDSISIKLREICPSLYKVEDAACSKANEILKSAKIIQNMEEKEELLQSALNLCKSIAPNLNLKEICGQFTSQKCYHAVTDLCATCAKAYDPESIAEHFYKNGDQNDHDSYQYYMKRMEIYKPLIEMLNTVHNRTQNINGLCNPRDEDSTTIIKMIIADAMRYPDELMHVAIYEWMMEKQMQGDLIAIPETTLETYLLKASKHNPNNIQVQDILWKYYESNDNHGAAAKVLHALATATNSTVRLNDRISYLTRSIMCMRNDKIGYAPVLGVFLNELEDKLDVARVQEHILDAIVALKGRNQNVQQAEYELNAKLFDLTELYEEYADKFELWECKLAIIHCAGYTDRNVIEDVWAHILRKELGIRTATMGNDAMLQILSKVKNVIEMYRDSNNCVPLDYLLRELERASAKLKADPSLVPNFFVSMKYSLELLIGSYNCAMIATTRDNFWLSEENQFHYSEAISALINNFIVTHEQFDNIKKRKLIAMCQDTIAGLLSNLYSKPNTDPIIQALRGLQSRLSRM